MGEGVARQARRLRPRDGRADALLHGPGARARQAVCGALDRGGRRERRHGARQPAAAALRGCARQGHRVGEQHRAQRAAPRRARARGLRRRRVGDGLCGGVHLRAHGLVVQGGQRERHHARADELEKHVDAPARRRRRDLPRASSERRRDVVRVGRGPSGLRGRVGAARARRRRLRRPHHDLCRERDGLQGQAADRARAREPHVQLRRCVPRATPPRPRAPASRGARSAMRSGCDATSNDFFAIPSAPIAAHKCIKDKCPCVHESPCTCIGHVHGTGPQKGGASRSRAPTRAHHPPRRAHAVAAPLRGAAETNPSSL